MNSLYRPAVAADESAFEIFDHVAEQDGEIVGVVAHHLLVGESGRVIAGHRYVMVTAIQRTYQRSGYATSIQFGNRAFPMADETSPPDSKPYLRLLLRL